MTLTVFQPCFTLQYFIHKYKRYFDHCDRVNRHVDTLQVPRCMYLDATKLQYIVGAHTLHVLRCRLSVAANLP